MSPAGNGGRIEARLQTDSHRSTDGTARDTRYPPRRVHRRRADIKTFMLHKIAGYQPILRLPKRRGWSLSTTPPDAGDCPCLSRHTWAARAADSVTAAARHVTVPSRGARLGTSRCHSVPERFGAASSVRYAASTPRSASVCERCPGQPHRGRHRGVARCRGRLPRASPTSHRAAARAPDGHLTSQFVGTHAVHAVSTIAQHSTCRAASFSRSPARPGTRPRA